jgi:lipopolysaccharide export system protein LptC
MPHYKSVIILFYNKLLGTSNPFSERSRVISVTKIVLLALAIIITATLVILPFASGVNKDFRLTFSRVEKTGEGDLPKMINPHLQGVSSGGQTYNISAESATQDKKETMLLENISGDINFKNNGWISLTANNGSFNHAANILDLKGNINVFNNDGYEFLTQEAHADMKQGIIYGNTEITGQGPIGNIRADSFYVENKGNYLLLKGKVKVIIFPKDS